MDNREDRFLMRLEVIRTETLGQLNELFRRMVQLEEELELVKQQIQVGRGLMDGLEQAQRAIKEITQGDKVVEFRAKKEEEAKSVLKSESKTSVPGTKAYIGGGEQIGTKLQ